MESFEEEVVAVFSLIFNKAKVTSLSNSPQGCAHVYIVLRYLLCSVNGEIIELLVDNRKEQAVVYCVQLFIFDNNGWGHGQVTLPSVFNSTFLLNLIMVGTHFF